MSLTNRRLLVTGVLVTGATGYLGRRVMALAPDAIALGHRDLDVTDIDAVKAGVAAKRPDAVLHLAAVNPGRGRDAAMTRVNVGGARAVAVACAALGVRLVHVSTDVVHDGTAAPYADDAPVGSLDRLGVYARSKAEGEEAVRSACPEAVIVRPSLVYDVDSPDAATAGFAARLADGEEVRLFVDALRQPVFAPELAAVVVALADSDVSGLTINVAGPQVLSRAEFGIRLLEWFDIPGRERVVRGPAPPGIPLDLRLRLDRARALGFRLRGVDEVLASAAPPP